MNIFGVGTAELLLLLVLGGVILGPRRLVGLAREAGKLVGQVRSLTAELTRQVNQEISLLDIADAKKASPSAQPGEAAVKLPEAYQRFRDDFPSEGQLADRGTAAVAAAPETPRSSPTGQ